MRPVEPPIEPLAAAGARSPGDAECDAGACVTCSDAAVPGTVRRLLDDDLAIVDTGAGKEEVSVALVSVTIGDVVYVHAGEAIAVRRDEPAPDTARDRHGPRDGKEPR
jgi:hydrogenase expression/formation protein HypC